jgi:hypothetical protein
LIISKPSSETRNLKAPVEIDIFTYEAIILLIWGKATAVGKVHTSMVKVESGDAFPSDRMISALESRTVGNGKSTSSFLSSRNLHARQVQSLGLKRHAPRLMQAPI